MIISANVTMELNYVLNVVLQAVFFAGVAFAADFLTAVFLAAVFLAEVFLAVFFTATFLTAATADFAATFLVALLGAAFLAGAFLAAAFRPRAGFFDGPAARRATRSAIASSSVTASAVTDRGQGGVGLTVRHIGPEAARLDHDGFGRFRIFSERSAGIGGAATKTTAVFLGDDEIDGAVAADLQHVVVIADIGVDLAVLNIGTIAPDAGRRSACPKPGASPTSRGNARSFSASLKVDRGRRTALWQRRALGLFAFAELQRNGTEAAVADRHRLAALRIVAENRARRAGRHSPRFLRLRHWRRSPPAGG